MRRRSHDHERIGRDDCTEKTLSDVERRQTLLLYTGLLNWVKLSDARIKLAQWLFLCLCRDKDNSAPE